MLYPFYLFFDILLLVDNNYLPQGQLFVKYSVNHCAYKSAKLQGQYNYATQLIVLERVITH